MERTNRGPPAIKECSREQMRTSDFAAVFGTFHDNKRCGDTHLCAFYATQGNCTTKPGMCAHKHEPRRAKMCPTTDCPNGAFCKYRHTGDVYHVWFYDRKRELFKCFMWKDRISQFSVHRVH